MLHLFCYCKSNHSRPFQKKTGTRAGFSMSHHIKRYQKFNTLMPTLKGYISGPLSSLNRGFRA